MKIRNKIYSICKPYDYEKYNNIDLNSLVVYVIDVLEKNGIPLSIENICVSTFLMFPKKFSLMGFDEFPDAMRINRVLLHLRPKYENLAEGNSKSGFFLTEKGKVKAKTAESLLEQNIPGKEIETRPKMEIKKIKEIKNSIAFNKFKQNKLNEIQIDEVYGFLQATPYTSKSNIRSYLNELMTIAEDLGDDDVVNFIITIKKIYGSFFKGD